MKEEVGHCEVNKLGSDLLRDSDKTGLIFTCLQSLGFGGGGVQSPNRVRLFVTPWTAAHQASLSPTISQSLPKFMSIASVMTSSHLIR